MFCLMKEVMFKRLRTKDESEYPGRLEGIVTKKEKKGVRNVWTEGLDLLF